MKIDYKVCNQWNSGSEWRRIHPRTPSTENRSFSLVYVGGQLPNCSCHLSCSPSRKNFWRTCWITSRCKGPGWGCFDGTFLTEVDAKEVTKKSLCTSTKRLTDVDSMGPSESLWGTRISLIYDHPSRTEWEEGIYAQNVLGNQGCIILPSQIQKKGMIHWKLLVHSWCKKAYYRSPPPPPHDWRALLTTRKWRDHSVPLAWPGQFSCPLSYFVDWGCKRPLWSGHWIWPMLVLFWQRVQWGQHCPSLLADVLHNQNVITHQPHQREGGRERLIDYTLTTITPLEIEREGSMHCSCTVKISSLFH